MQKLLAKIILILLLFSNFNFLFKVKAFSSGDILITELGYDTQTQNESEWFELYNPTNNDIDISNWKITENGGKFYIFSGITIKAHDFLVVTNDEDTFYNEFGKQADIDMDNVNGSDCSSDKECLKLNDNGDSLTLEDGSGNIIDQVGWEGVDGYDLSADKDYSICRRNLNDTDTDAEWANNCNPSFGTGIFVRSLPGGISVVSLLWLKADSENYNSGDIVSTFHDHSGNNRDGIADNNPIFDKNNIFNFYPTIYFDGNSGLDFPKYSLPIGDKNYTIFIVFKSDLTQSGTLVYVGRNTKNGITRLNVNVNGSLSDDFNNGENNLAITNSGIIKENQIVFTSFNYNTNNNDKNIFVNGNKVLQKLGIDDHNASNTSSSKRSIGYDATKSNNYFKGNIAEIISYDSELSTENRQKIDSYLALKYGITLKHNYINSSGTILWDSSANSTYTNDIIGIGQDNISDLDQKISHSVNSGAILTISTSNDFTSLNTDVSRTSLDNGKFLIIGNNAGNLNSSTGDLDLSNYIERINRERKISNIGDVGKVFLKFDGFDDKYILLKDSDGDFSNGAVNLGNLSASGTITTNLNDGEYFTLVKPILNQAPTDISLDNSSIDENNLSGALIGNLSTIDADTGDTHTYSFTGAGNDNSSFVLSGSQLLAGEVFDFEVKDSYTIRILTDDGNGGTFEKEFTITINDLDDEAPVVSLSGATTMDVLKNTTFTDPGATWTDNVDGTGTLTSASSGTVDTGTIGTYTLEYTYTDQAGNAGNIVTRTVNVVSGDTPVITLNGDENITIEIGSTYTDLGATYSDTEDGTGSLTATGTVDTNTLGTYILTYDYTDSQGNVATQVTRTVNVVDTIAPAVILNTLTGITTDNSASISWQTNEPTSSEIIYGLTTTFDKTTGEQDISPKVTSHSLKITGLESCTKYYYKTISRDEAGNETIDGIYDFTTKGCAGNSEILEEETTDIVPTGSGATGTGKLELGTGEQKLEIEVPVGYFDTGTGSCAGKGVYFQLKEIEKNPVVSSLGKVLDKTISTYDLSAYCSTQEKVHNFDKNLKITITYTDDEIKDLKEDSLAIFRYNTETKLWQKLDNCVVDKERNQISCETNHFSTFSVSGETKPIFYDISGVGGHSGKVKHMDVCNENGGDFSGDYYDGKCGINPNKKEEETKKDNKKLKEQKDKKQSKEKLEEQNKEKENFNLKERKKELIFENKKEKVYRTIINGKEIKYSVKNIKSCKIIPNILKTLNILKENNIDLGKLTKLKDLNDVKFKKEIIALELNRIINGDINKNFNASQKITRAEFLKIVLLSHCYDYNNSDPSDLNYKDLDKRTWQAKVIKKATEIGLIHGYEDKTVKPDRIISKVEAFKILYNLRILRVGEGRIKTNNYDDVKEDWEKDLVKNLESLGIIDSKTDKNKFNPDNGVDREFMVDYLIKTIKLY